MENVKCPCCGTVVASGKFCANCGSLLDNAEVTAQQVTENVGFDALMPLNFEERQIQNTSVSDEGLTMLVDCCQKTLATAYGDGYSEYVLYQRSEDEYELHYYSKQPSAKEETHFAYKSSKEIVDEVYTYLKEANLQQYAHIGFGLCGGDYVVKYLLDGQANRFSLSDFDYTKREALYKVEKIITSCVNEENKLD